MEHRPSSSDVDSHRSRSIAENALEEQYRELSSLYLENEELEESAKKLAPNADRTRQKLDALCNKFVNFVNHIIDELTFLGQAHPIVAVTVFAFRELVKSDIARRENNEKILVVVIQMQSVLGPIFQLEKLGTAHMLASVKGQHETNLTRILDVIKQAIDKCRSDVTEFMGKKPIYKYLLARKYEKVFAGHMRTFSRCRHDLQYIIATYVAVGISTANASIPRVEAKIDNLDAKLDKIIPVIFRNLDTAYEKDNFKFIEQHGGPKECIEDLELLKILHRKSEAPTNGKADTPDTQSQADWNELQNSLRDALEEDLDEVLKKYYSRFEKILEVNLNNLTSNLMDHSFKLDKLYDATVTIIRVLEEGKIKTKIQLKDPEIHDIWNQMNIGIRSVKAKVFVLTLRDHIRTENSTMASPTHRSALPAQSEDEIQETAILPSDIPNLNQTPDDDWAFEYIDVAYVQPIVDAMDEDGSGFISVKEANSFALSRDRPKDMKFLIWIAYWAAGWHINLVKYQSDIYSILLQMDEAASSTHVANQVYVKEFLDRKVMRRIEALCQSLKPLLHSSRRDPKLLAAANDVASWQLNRLTTNLEALGFIIESPFVATTISGSPRIELCIFPILYLLLQRHLGIIKLAQTVVLHPAEFSAHVTSLTSVFSVFDERKENLQAKFAQLSRDVDSQFRAFAYGMFYAAHKQDEFNIALNTFPSLRSQWTRSCDQKETITEEKGQSPNISILSKAPADVPDFAILDLLPSTLPPTGHVAHPIEGTWFGRTDIALYTCVIHPVVQNKLVGKGEAIFGALEIMGVVSPISDPEIAKFDVKFKLIPDIKTSRTLSCQAFEGLYDAVNDTLNGTHKWVLSSSEQGHEDNEDSEEQNGGNVFCFTRTVHHLFHLRTYLDGPAPLPAWDTWTQARKRWVFATEAVLFEKQNTLQKTIPEKLIQRKQWLYYAVKSSLQDPEITQYPDEFPSLSEVEWQAYIAMVKQIPPHTARIWEETGLFMTRRQTFRLQVWLTCDMCGNYVTFCRYHCVECTGMRSDYIQTIDICQDCFENKKNKDCNASGFIHFHTHSLLRSRTWIQNYELNSLSHESRFISERCKKLFKNLEDQKKNKRTGKIIKGKLSRKPSTEKFTNTLTDPIKCARCEEQVSLPCWVCVECIPLAFICIHCDLSNKPVMLPKHSVLEHHLLFIHDSNEIKPAEATKGSEVERQLYGLNTSVNDINLQLRKLKAIVERTARNLGSQGDDLSDADPECEQHSGLEEDEEREGEKEKEEETEESKPVESDQPIASRTVKAEAGQLDIPAGVSGSQANLPTRLKELETRVDSILEHLAGDDRKVYALEKKLDKQFEMLAALIRKDLTSERTAHSTSSFYGSHNV